MRKYTLFIGLIALGLSVGVQAAETKTCVLRLLKSNCWDKYEVITSIVRAMNMQKIGTGKIGKKERQKNIEFECPLGEPLTFRAKFSPAIWEENAGKSYPAKQVWDVPREFPKDMSKWIITVCYPNDFQSLPLPPSMDEKCGCDEPKPVDP